MEFEWDDAKNEANIATHGIDFTRAKEISGGTVLNYIEAARFDPDNPPLDEEFFRHVKIVTPPPKKAINLRVDEDVLEWFKRGGKQQPLRS